MNNKTQNQINVSEKEKIRTESRFNRFTALHKSELGFISVLASTEEEAIKKSQIP